MSIKKLSEQSEIEWKSFMIQLKWSVNENHRWTICCFLIARRTRAINWNFSFKVKKFFQAEVSIKATEALKMTSITNLQQILSTDLFRTFLRRRQSLQEASNLHRKDYGAI